MPLACVANLSHGRPASGEYGGLAGRGNSPRIRRAIQRLQKVLHRIGDNCYRFRPERSHEIEEDKLWSIPTAAQAGAQLGLSPAGKWMPSSVIRTAWRSPVRDAPASGGTPSKLQKGTLSMASCLVERQHAYAFDANDGRPSRRPCYRIANIGDNPAGATVTTHKQGRARNRTRCRGGSAPLSISTRTRAIAADLFTLGTNPGRATVEGLIRCRGDRPLKICRTSVLHFPEPMASRFQDGFSCRRIGPDPPPQKRHRQSSGLWRGVNQNYNGLDVKRNTPVYYSFHQYLYSRVMSFRPGLQRQHRLRAMWA